MLIVFEINCTVFNNTVFLKQLLTDLVLQFVMKSVCAVVQVYPHTTEK